MSQPVHQAKALYPFLCSEPNISMTTRTHTAAGLAAALIGLAAASGAQAPELLEVRDGMFKLKFMPQATLALSYRF